VNGLFVSDLDECLHRLRSQRIDLDHLRPELELALNAFIWYSSVHCKQSTLAQSLLRLRLIRSSDRQPLSNTQSIGFLVADVITPWLVHRLSARSSRTGSLERLQHLYKMANLLNFLVFLRKGVYLKLWHRMLGIAVGASKGDMFTHHNFEFMNEQLLFFAASEFVSFVVPLVNMPLVRNSLRIQWNRLRKSTSTAVTTTSASTLPDSKTCFICKLVAFNPQQIGCRHVFCYYCVRNAFEQDRYNGFTCFDCDHNIKSDRQIVPFKISCI
jgi:peroxin-2